MALHAASPTWQSDRIHGAKPIFAAGIKAGRAVHRLYRPNLFTKWASKIASRDRFLIDGEEKGNKEKGTQEEGGYEEGDAGETDEEDHEDGEKNDQVQQESGCGFRKNEKEVGEKIAFDEASYEEESDEKDGLEQGFYQENRSEKVGGQYCSQEKSCHEKSCHEKSRQEKSIRSLQKAA